MRNIKIMLLVSTLVFASDIGPLHPFLPVIAAASTVLFGVTTWLLYQHNQTKPSTSAAAYMGMSALMCFLVGLITLRYIAGGMTEIPNEVDPSSTKAYDISSTALLLGAIVANIVGIFWLKDEPETKSKSSK